MNSKSFSLGCIWEQHKNRLFEYVGRWDSWRSELSVPASDRSVNVALETSELKHIKTSVKLLLFSELLLFLCCTKLHKLHKLQTFFFSSLLALAFASRLEVVWGYEASELKPMGFRLADLTGHYNAAEMLGAGWSKDRAFGKALAKGWDCRQVNSSVFSGRAVEALPADGVWAQAARRLESAKMT